MRPLRSRVIPIQQSRLRRICPAIMEAQQWSQSHRRTDRLATQLNAARLTLQTV